MKQTAPIIRATQFDGARVKKLRGAADLTQEQFAALLGVTFSTVNRWENDKSTPNLIARRLLTSLERKYGVA